MYRSEGQNSEGGWDFGVLGSGIYEHVFFPCVKFCDAVLIYYRTNCFYHALFYSYYRQGGPLEARLVERSEQDQGVLR